MEKSGRDSTKPPFKAATKSLENFVSKYKISMKELSNDKFMRNQSGIRGLHNPHEG